MATSPSKTDAQRQVIRTIDAATSTVVAYTAPTVPALENLTVEGMVEELGYLNEARKKFEGVEKIVKERLKSRLGGLKEVRSDNFTMTFEDRPRVALNQSKAKAYFEEQGTLQDFMDETSVPTMTFKRNGA
jgi:hypothetical protein